MQDGAKRAVPRVELVELTAARLRFGSRVPARYGVASGAMRKNLIKKGDEHLRYEIREIVEIANEIVKRGVPMMWENIGDPVAKGEALPAWM